MRYFGGKNRIGRQLASVINKYIGNKDFYSLFTGSGGVEQYIKANNKYYNDLHPFLKILYDELVTGWLPTVEECSELFNVDFNDYYNIKVKELYIKLKKDKNLFKKYQNKQLVYICIIGFSCGFGGMWMSGFAKGEKRNFFNEGIDSLQNKQSNCLTVNLRHFTTMDYKTYANIKNAVVYCDPPYDNTREFSTGKFNNNEFWKFASELSKNNIVFVSEYKAHKDFIPIKTIEYTKGMRGKNKAGNWLNAKTNELLLVHKSLILNNSVSIEPKQLSFFDKEISHYTV